MSPSPHSRTSRRIVAALIYAGVVLLVGAGLGYRAASRPGWVAADAQPTPSPSADAAPTPTPTATPTPIAPRTYAAKGPGTYEFAQGQSEIFGTAGTLKKYRVAIETGTPVPIEEFTANVDATLSDERSWIAGKNVRLQRVSDKSYNFTIYLVTPGTAQKICLAGGYDIVWHGEPYTSCRVGGKVVINIARYLHAIPEYADQIEAYQQYAINHEVGHALGHGHELCPGKGKLAPVMAQQTFGLYGCVPNSWPYVDGERYAGPPGRIVPAD